MNITVDGHRYLFIRTENATGYELTVQVASGGHVIGTINVNMDLEHIQYERDDGETGTLPFSENMEHKHVDTQLATWLAGSEY